MSIPLSRRMEIKSKRARYAAALSLLLGVLSLSEVSCFGSSNWLQRNSNYGVEIKPFSSQRSSKYVSRRYDGMCFFMTSENQQTTQDSTTKKTSATETKTNTEENAEQTNKGTDTNSDNNEKKKTKTLYEILGADPSMTKAEMKRLYNALARQTHPDVLRHRDDSSSSKSSDYSSMPEESFAEIAAAWEVLSDPQTRKKYDRSLKADAFQEDVERLASKVGERAGPPVKRMFEKVAIPLLRRTTATTVASFNAAAAGKTNPLFAALEAGQKAARVIDEMELIEKSDELEKQAQEEFEKASMVGGELLSMTSRRLKLALQTPESKLSSKEALQLLAILGINIDSDSDQASWTEATALNRHMMLSSEIEALKAVESYEENSKKESLSAQAEHGKKSRKLSRAKDKTSVALEVEARARAALAAAEERVAQARLEEEEASKAKAASEVSLKFAEMEAERYARGLNRQRERVRLYLLKRQDGVFADQKRDGGGESGGSDDMAGGAAVFDEDTTLEFSSTPKEEIEVLKSKEEILAFERDQLENRARRLLAEAEQIRKMALSQSLAENDSNNVVDSSELTDFS